MKKNVPEGNPQEKKSGSKKPLLALVVAAILGFGVYGGAQYYNENYKTNEQEQAKEKVTIQVSAEKVTINGQEQKPAEGQTWKALLEAYFAKKDMGKTEVVVDFAYGDYDLAKEIRDALSELKISTTEAGGGK